jgi:hypothetical protein
MSLEPDDKVKGKSEAINNQRNQAVRVKTPAGAF